MLILFSEFHKTHYPPTAQKKSFTAFAERSLQRKFSNLKLVHSIKDFGKSTMLNCITSSCWYHLYFNLLDTQCSFDAVRLQYMLGEKVVVCDCISELFVRMVYKLFEIQRLIFTLATLPLTAYLSIKRWNIPAVLNNILQFQGYHLPPWAYPPDIEVLTVHLTNCPF